MSENIHILYIQYMKQKFITWDKIVSYWIFVWFLIYVIASYNRQHEIGRFIYDNTNPLILLCIGFFQNLYMLVLILMYNPKIHIIIFYVIEMFLLKVLLIAFLLQQKIKWMENIMFSAFILIVYFFYLYLLHQNVFTIYKNIQESISHDDNNTPMLYYLGLLYSKIKNAY